MLEKNSRDLLYFLGCFYLQHRKVDKAKTLFNALRATGEDNWKIHMALGQIGLMEKEFEVALKEARIAHGFCGNRKEERQTLFLLARALWQHGEKDEAHIYFRKFMETGA